MARPLCNNWQCPAKASCARHIGRSEACHAMRMPEPATYRGAREADADSCEDYERDLQREWMMDAGRIVPVPGAMFGYGWLVEAGS